MTRPLPVLFWGGRSWFSTGLLFLISGWTLLCAQPDRYRLERLPTDCCFRFGYTQLPPAGPITGLDVALTAPGARFTDLTTEPAAGWSYQLSADRQRIAWRWSAFSLPGAAPDLFDFCLAGSETEATGLAIAWRSGPATVQTDTLDLSCTTCTELESLVALCRATGALSYEFRYRNASTFRVDHLRILEPAGQDLIPIDRIDLPSGVLPGALSDTLSLPLLPAAEGVAELCFELVASRTLASGESVACCYQRYCLAGPVCDRCCTAEADFVAAVERGFDWREDCPNFTGWVQPRALGPCDLVEWRVRPVSAGNGIGTTRTGNEPFQFTVADPGEYAVEMRVRRTDLTGKACYDTVWRAFRDTILLGEIICVDAIDVPARFSVRLWPNPASAELHLSLPAPGTFAIACFDLSGRAYDLPLLARTDRYRRYALSGLPAGTYFLRIRSPAGAMLTRKFYKLN
jgi:hypothetical protein